MPSARRQKKSTRPSPRARPPARRPTAPPPARKAAKPSAAKKAAPKSTRAPPPKGSAKPAPSPPVPPLEVPLPGGRRHVLSLSFVRDGDEFLARLETDSGHITELKNRSLDQLLTLVAGELEDLLE
jgi:hypothetical protein